MAEGDPVTLVRRRIDNRQLEECQNRVQLEDVAGQPINAANPLAVNVVAGGGGGNVTVINGPGPAAVNVQDGGNALTVDGSVAVINGAGAAAVNVQDGGNSLTVDGSVTAVAQPGVDIGDVTINNGAGAAAVQIQDGGNTITVDGTVALATPPTGIMISVVPGITAGAYIAKDAVGGLMTFANAVRAAGGTAILNSIVIGDNDDEKAGLELWLFSQDPTAVADNAPMDFPDASMAYLQGIVPIATADYYSLLDNGAACLRGVGLEFKCAATSLFGQLKCTGTPTYTAISDLTVTLGIEYLS